MKRLLLTLALVILPFASIGQDKTYSIVAKTQVGPGNIAVAPTGRIFITLHQLFDPDRHVVEVLSDGALKSFPNDDWQKDPQLNGITLVSPLGIQVDDQNTLWIMDNGSRPPKLVAWDLNFNKLKSVIPIPYPVVGNESFINDMAVDLKNNAIYIADMIGDHGPGIIVVNLTTNQTRRVLVNSPSVRPEPEAQMIIEGREVRRENGEPHRNGLNPITIDPQNQWVYYGAMHGTSIYRIRTRDLLDETLNDEILEGRVQRYGDKPVSDGITVDNAGNVYITDVTANGIGVTFPDGSYKLLFSDDSFLWPDSLSVGPDNYIYAVINQLNRSAFLNGGKDIAKPPYLIIRFKSLADASPGR